MASRIALCHEWITTWGGSERVSRQIATSLDIADIYTFTADPQLVPRVFGDRQVNTARVGRTSLAREHWQWMLPVIARWWRSLDLAAYDLVITCSHSVVNSVQVREGALHVSYCCTPMRYAWKWRTEARRLPAALRPLLPAIATVLRAGDKRRAANVDLFLADSKNVAARIEHFYGRRSVVLYPPVDTDFFSPAPTVARDDFFLLIGRLVAYKRPDIAVRAANGLGIRLVVAGDGPELTSLRALAGPTVEFRTDTSDEELRDLYRRARAVLFPGVEDFGIVPVEAQACGTPVIALAEGGVLETVRPETGLLYEDGSVDGLLAAVRAFDAAHYEPADTRANVERFGASHFDERLRAIVSSLDRRTAINDVQQEFGEP